MPKSILLEMCIRDILVDDAGQYKKKCIKGGRPILCAVFCIVRPSSNHFFSYIFMYPHTHTQTQS